MREDYVVEFVRPHASSAWTRALHKDEPVDVVIRPEDIDIVPEPDGITLTGTVDELSRSRACTMT